MGFTIHYLYILSPGAIHHDLHEGNIICLDHTHVSHIGPDVSRTEALYQYGVIDFGDMTMSCCVFDLTVFLHVSTQCKEKPPIEYLEYLKRLATERNSKAMAGKNINEATKITNSEKTEIRTTEKSRLPGDVPRVKDKSSSLTIKDPATTGLLGKPCTEDQPSHGDPSDYVEPVSHERDEVILSGHAIAGYLTTSALTELEWEVLMASLCARYSIILMGIRGNLPEDVHQLEKVTGWEWNAMKSLRRLLHLGKDGINAIWKGVCKDYGIVC